MIMRSRLALVTMACLAAFAALAATPNDDDDPGKFSRGLATFVVSKCSEMWTIKDEKRLQEFEDRILYQLSLSVTGAERQLTGIREQLSQAKTDVDKATVAWVDALAAEAIGQPQADKKAVADALHKAEKRLEELKSLEAHQRAILNSIPNLVANISACANDQRAYLQGSATTDTTTSTGTDTSTGTTTATGEQPGQPKQPDQPQAGAALRLEGTFSATCTNEYGETDVSGKIAFDLGPLPDPWIAGETAASGTIDFGMGPLPLQGMLKRAAESNGAKQASLEMKTTQEAPWTLSGTVTQSQGAFIIAGTLAAQGASKTEMSAGSTCAGRFNGQQS
jgi:hypothetical protein